MDEKIKSFVKTLSADVKAKLKECKNPEEMVKVLDENNITIDPEILDAVSGGWSGQNPYMPGWCDECSGQGC